MIFATVISDLIALISKSKILIGQCAGRGGATTDAITGGVLNSSVHGTATGKATGTATRQVYASACRIVTVLLVASGLAIFTRSENQRYGTVPALLGVGRQVSHVIEALKSLHFQPPPQSTVLMRIPENAFTNRWHGVFAAYLLWNDHSLLIWLDGVMQLTPEQLAKVDYIIFLNEFQARVIRAPEVPQ
jgi:hypothetical protein